MLEPIYFRAHPERRVLGIIPILIANNAKDALRRGDFAKAESDIGTAKLLCILGYVGVGLALLFYIVYFVIILGVLAGAGLR